MKDRFTRQAARLQKQLDALGPNPHDTFHPLPADKREAKIARQYAIPKSQWRGQWPGVQLGWTNFRKTKAGIEYF
jgi:hypothetical protein